MNTADAERDLQELKRALETCDAARKAAEQRAERAMQIAEDVERFVDALAHDLRAPLRSVMSYTQLLERRLPDDPEIKELASLIVAGASEMQLLLESIQQLTKAGKSPSRTSIRLDVIVQLAQLRLQERIKQQGALVHFGGLPEVLVNESQFVNLFEQLIGNSLTYRKSEPPKIEILSEENGDEYTISVRDNGQGIHPDYQQKVFDPFLRLHGKSIAGTGLGLTISRRIVEAHGGRIWVESDGQTGSNFRFTLPM